MSRHEDRHSKAEDVELIHDPIEKAKREAENGVRQYAHAIEVIKGHIPNQNTCRFRLRQRLILESHKIALDGVHLLAGTYRNSPISIGASSHIPPESSHVADLMAEMCDFVNENWDSHGANYLAAYILWRLNWIHPFADGNGRTARVISYIVMSIKLQGIFPGTPAIPDQIAQNKAPYYEALEESDAGMGYIEPTLVLSKMESMLDSMLAKQLYEATKEAGT